ncbi:MAG TPA: hypothetical protein VFC58_13320 [Desulfosporosinus sp.]|nr:hypothetical protein [Desulfosporosinus sp.]
MKGKSRRVPSIKIFMITFITAQIAGYGFNIQLTGGEQPTHFSLFFISLMISYGLGHLMGYKFRSMVPQGKGFEVGLASCIGILIFGFTIVFFFPEVRYLRELLNAVFGLAFGFGYSIGKGKVT